MSAQTMAVPGPTRRRRSAFVLLVVGLVLLATWTPGWAFTTAPLWSVLVLVTLVAAAAAGATLVPGPGEALLAPLRCGGCALVDALAAGAGAWLALTSAHDGGTASLALALAGFALARRLTTSPSCDSGR